MGPGPADGGRRRASEAQATAADLETARLSLQAELAFDYFELRSADAQQHCSTQTVAGLQRGAAS